MQQNLGISVLIRFKDNSDGTVDAKCGVSWDNGTTWSDYSAEQSVTGSVYENKTYGSSTELWGRSEWYAGELSNDNFQLRIQG